MTTHRAFMNQLLDACKDQGWSCRPKDNGFQVSPPRDKRRPGFETLFIFLPKDHHDRKVMATRLKQAGLPISLVESNIKIEEPTDMPTPTKPANTLPVPAVIEVRPGEPTLERVRRKVLAIADMCAEVVVDLDQLAQERADIDQLKNLMKKIGG